MAGSSSRDKAPTDAVPADEPLSEPAVRLNAAFVRAVLADWEAHGTTAIAAVRAARPHDYLKLVTGLFPSEDEGRADEFDALTDQQLAAELARILAQLAAAGADPGPRGGAAEEA